MKESDTTTITIGDKVRYTSKEDGKTKYGYVKKIGKETGLLFVTKIGGLMVALTSEECEVVK